MKSEKNEIILFENQGVHLEVNIKDETVWLTQDQMAELFGKAKSTINEHIKNIYRENELEESETLTKFGNSEFSDKPTNYYNLDMIISVGFRVKSKNGIVFRKWATKVLKDYALKGYAINEQRLEYLKKTVKLIDIAGRVTPRLAADEAKEILEIIANYSKALHLLDEYDRHSIKKINGKIDDRKIAYRDCVEIIEELKAKIDSSLFGVERKKGLESIIDNVYQNIGGEDVYKSVEEKATNFLYLIVKNHVFIDGNKRIAATLFIYFLNFYGILYQNSELIIDNNALAALTLLIAESHPKEKATLISLIMNFLVIE